MMTERRWYRDPALPLPLSEVTRFPHCVLEVKRSLPEGQKAPEWVADLLDSGYLTEVSPLLHWEDCPVCLQQNLMSAGHVTRERYTERMLTKSAVMVGSRTEVRDIQDVMIFLIDGLMGTGGLPVSFVRHGPHYHAWL